MKNVDVKILQHCAQPDLNKIWSGQSNFNPVVEQDSSISSPISPKIKIKETLEKKE
jgi:hypothetical protein